MPFFESFLHAPEHPDEERTQMSSSSTDTRQSDQSKRDKSKCLRRYVESGEFHFISFLLVVLETALIAFSLVYDFASVMSERDDCEDAFEDLKDLSQQQSLRRSLLQTPYPSDYDDAYEAEFDEPDFGSDYWKSAKQGLFIASIVVLSAMLLESLLLFFANGPQKFFSHFSYIADLIIIVTSIATELSFQGITGIEALIVLRFWKLIRFGYGFYESKQKSKQKEKQGGKGKVERSDDENKNPSGDTTIPVQDQSPQSHRPASSSSRGSSNLPFEQTKL